MSDLFLQMWDTRPARSHAGDLGQLRVVAAVTLSGILMEMLGLSSCVQVTKYVEREILNHRVLMHPHIVQFKEVGHARCRMIQGLSFRSSFHRQ